jgi:hypothetical protein
MTKKHPKKTGDASAADCDMPEKPGVAAERPTVRITPFGEKIGESDDNLAGRGDWFSRRTGTKK